MSVSVCPRPSVGQAGPWEEYPSHVRGDRAGHLDEMVLTRGLLSVKPKSKTSFWRAGLKTITLIQGFPGGLEDEVSTCNAGDLGSIPGLGRSPGGGVL